MFKKFLKNPWTITIGGTVIAFIITSLMTKYINNINIFESMKLIFKFIFIILKINIPLGLILVVIFIALIITKIIIKINKNRKIIKNLNVDWLNYKKDFYQNWNIHWDYIQKNEKEYEISNIKLFCPNCDCELSSKIVSGYSEMYCPNCRKYYKYGGYEVKSDFQKIIIHNINTGNYKDTKYFNGKK